MGKKSREKRLRRQEQQPSQHGALVAAYRREEFSGPVPPPTLLKQYDDIIPGAAGRILEMAERQSIHRINLEEKIVSSDVKKSEKGQIFGLIVALAGLSAALILGINGYEIAASIIGGADVVSLAGIFVIGKWKKSENLKKSRG